jgi:hypothetical protein
VASVMLRLALTLIPLALLAFWLWMFADMTKNDNLPECLVSFTNGRDARLDWKIAFIFLNLFAAIVYYFNVYRNRY